MPYAHILVANCPTTSRAAGQQLGHQIQKRLQDTEEHRARARARGRKGAPPAAGLIDGHVVDVDCVFRGGLVREGGPRLRREGDCDATCDARRLPWRYLDVRALCKRVRLSQSHGPHMSAGVADVIHALARLRAHQQSWCSRQLRACLPAGLCAARRHSTGL